MMYHIYPRDMFCSMVFLLRHGLRWTYTTKTKYRRFMAVSCETCLASEWFVRVNFCYTYVYDMVRSLSFGRIPSICLTICLYYDHLETLYRDLRDLLCINLEYGPVNTVPGYRHCVGHRFLQAGCPFSANVWLLGRLIRTLWAARRSNMSSTRPHKAYFLNLYHYH